MQTIRTLIVDDEARIRRGIERLVLSCGEGWEVVATAADGFEALEYLRQSEGAVDLLITDVKMPEMDGLTLIKEAKKEYAFYPLLISGYDDFAYVQTALREGALDYFLKPVDREQFRQRLVEIKARIASGRYENQKRGELERESERLKRSRQIHTLSYITSADIELTSLGYWVDEFPKGRCLLSYIRMDSLPFKSRSYTAKDWKAYFYVLDNIIAEVVENHLADTDRQGWCWRGADSDFWTLIHTPDDEWDLEADAIRLADLIRSSVQTYTPFSVSVSFGHDLNDLYLLPDAKKQALDLMNYRFLYGGNQVFQPSLEGRGTRSKESDLLPLVQKLKKSVEQANEQETAALSTQLFEQWEKLDSPDVLQKAVHNAVILVHSAVLESKGRLDRPASLEHELHQLNKAANLQELKLYVKRLIDDILAEIRLSRDSANMRPVEQAKEWIVQNLDQDVTVKKIADQVYMNPTYFCEYFKMQTGETILDYLTGQRMERATELLRDPRLKLGEISLRVGYQDVKYFGRLFKQREGQTLSQYREHALYGQGGGQQHGTEP